MAPLPPGVLTLSSKNPAYQRQLLDRTLDRAK